ncbi:MAG: hypothetical protein IKT91_03645, partial [Clostridia bacterium]|nr:hypothetical protein [Clostridia bacterium]
MGIRDFFASPKYKTLFTVITFVLVLCLLCLGEYFLSNGLRMETTSYETHVLDLNQAALRGKTTRYQEGILMQAGSSIVFYDVGEEIINVSVTLERADLKIINATISISDDADKNAFRTYVDGDVYTDEPAYFRIRSFGNVRDLRIQINEGETALLTSVVLNRVPDVKFSFLRVALLFFLILGFGWYGTSASGRSYTTTKIPFTLPFCPPFWCCLFWSSPFAVPWQGAGRNIPSRIPSISTP